MATRARILFMVRVQRRKVLARFADSGQTVIQQLQPASVYIGLGMGLVLKGRPNVNNKGGDSDKMRS